MLYVNCREFWINLIVLFFLFFLLRPSSTECNMKWSIKHIETFEEYEFYKYFDYRIIGTRLIILLRSTTVDSTILIFLISGGERQ